MQKYKPTEEEEPLAEFNIKKQEVLDDLNRVHCCIQDLGRKIESGEIVSNTDPQVTGELYKRSMRDVDNGKTLARVADLSGWEWPARAAQALIDSIKSGDQDESTPAGRTALEHAFEIIE